MENTTNFGPGDDGIPEDDYKEESDVDSPETTYANDPPN